MAETKAITKPAKKTLVLEGDPNAQLEYAQKAAQALMVRVNSKKKQVIIGGKQYLEFGDWQTLARFFGATVGVEWTKPIERAGKLEGYEARAIVYQHGETISAAEASCMRAERNWKDRDEFAVKSMAQTRASAKALRNAFGWVAELAGYASTPAEEMDGVKTIENDKPRFASMKQVELMVNKVKWGLKEYDKDEVVGWLDNVLGKPLQEVTMDEVDSSLEKIDKALRSEKVAERIKEDEPDPVVELTEEQLTNGINIEDLPY
jgi:hypothetical protein